MNSSGSSHASHSSHDLEQPGLQLDPRSQPGLEVLGEPEGLHVLRGPHFEKLVEAAPTGHPYFRQQQEHSPVSTGYGQYNHSAYPESGYPASHAYNQSGEISPGAEKPTTAAPATIFGVPRRRFWLVFGSLIALLVIGIALGVGLGVGLSGSNSTSTLSSTTATSSTAAAPTATSSTIICSSGNDTTYLTDGSSFTILCNIDYNSGDGAEDLDHYTTATVDDCATACASNSECVGAGWGDYEQNTYCWLKSKLGTPQAAANWYFMVKQ